ncbi:hypothetical protein [Bdellovibrio sp. HCB337]|uniref:hypothetical protein n=1 Tax=Bdellovibrio sp. HCB337 TaxID=3394358 RepID=UPI0039A65195
MKHKISFLILILLTSACSVEVKDKKEAQPIDVQKLSVTDYLIDSAVTLTEDQTLEADRLILTKNAVITTESYNLTIIAKEIVSEGGVIRQFADEARASWEQNGRSGKMITLKAKKASGQLRIELRGEAGGNGRNGRRLIATLNLSRVIDKGCPGSGGGRGGDAGVLYADIADMRALNMNWKNDEGTMGNAGIGFSASPGDQNAIQTPCDHQVQGGNGQPGSKGKICLKAANQESFQCL